MAVYSPGGILSGGGELAEEYLISDQTLHMPQPWFAQSCSQLRDAKFLEQKEA